MDLDFNTLVKVIPGAIIGMTVHEFAHAYTAYKLGDNTAKEQGRVSLNPLKHIDWLGFLLIIVAGFGWAKPVMFNPENLKNKHRDEILISIAGPISNLIMAFISFILIRLMFGAATNQYTDNIVSFLLALGAINIGLFVFNLIPIPPLDGSHVYMTFLKDTNPRLMVNLYRYGMLGLFVLIMAENKLNINILHISEMVQSIIGFFVRVLCF